MLGDGPERRFGGGWRQAFTGNRGRREFGIGWRRSQIRLAEPDNHKGQPFVPPKLGLQQNAGDLSAADKNIVRPFASWRADVGSQLSERIADRQACDKSQLRGLFGSAPRP